MTRHHASTVHLPTQRAGRGGTRGRVPAAASGSNTAGRQNTSGRQRTSGEAGADAVDVQPAGLKGGFRFNVADGSWWWSVGMYTLHGIHPERLPWVAPTTRLLLSHLYPADRQALTDAWLHLLTGGAQVAFRYRIVGEDGFIRPVFTMASTDDADSPTVVTGVMQLDEPPRQP